MMSLLNNTYLPSNFAPVIHLYEYLDARQKKDIVDHDILFFIQSGQYKKGMITTIQIDLKIYEKL